MLQPQTDANLSTVASFKIVMHRRFLMAISHGGVHLQLVALLKIKAFVNEEYKILPAVAETVC